MKTLAIRLDDDLHAQISMLAQLRESSITDEIRDAIGAHLEVSKSDPELSVKAEAALDEIKRDADARRDALATMFGSTEQAKTTRSRGRTTKAD